MSETIGEMILPGTYIDVRAEGLIGVSGIATGNVGVVGTANRGPLGEVKVLASYSEALETFGSYDRWQDGTPTTPSLTLTRTLEQVFSGGASSVYAIRIANVSGTMGSQLWTVNAGTTAVFTFSANTPGTWANSIEATLETPASEPVKLTLEYNRAKETFEGANAAELAAAINASSRWVVATTPSTANASLVPTTPVVKSTTTVGGPDGAAATGTEVAEALATLANENINILCIGGLAADDIADEVLAHVEATETDGKERIAVIGAEGDDTADVLGNADLVSNGRVVLVAPGIRDDDAARVGEQNKEVALTPPYAAALVAGRLAGLAPHVSLTNKDLPAGGLTRYYTRAQQKQLLNKNVMVLFRQLGIRVLKGNSTDTGAFKQISVRRIVDYAKEGVRRGSNPYIGKLNNARVRAALKATLDGFLSGMVLDEMLTAYTLEVSATRAQEINGICLVTMTLQPTFSIDFVKVIMTLE